MLSTTGEGNRKIEWAAVTKWRSRQTTRGLVEAVVEECRDAEFAAKHQVHVRITPTGQAPRDFFIPVAGREAGEALVAAKLTAAI